MPVPDASISIERRSELSQAIVAMIRITVDVTAIAMECLAPNVKSNRQVQLMTLVARNEGITPASLAERMRTSRSMVSQVLRGVVREGLVYRDTDPRDHRSIRICLSGVGHKSIAGLEAKLASYFIAHRDLIEEATRLLGGGSEDERRLDVDVFGAAGRIAAAAAPYTTEASHLMAPWGFGDHERFILTLVSEPGPHRPNELGTTLGISSAAVSSILDRMENVGAVRRRRDANFADGRAVLIEPTAAGRRTAEDLAVALAPHAPGLAATLQATLTAAARASVA